MIKVPVFDKCRVLASVGFWQVSVFGNYQVLVSAGLW